MKTPTSDQILSFIDKAALILAGFWVLALVFRAKEAEAETALLKGELHEQAYEKERLHAELEAVKQTATTAPETTAATA